MERCYPLSEDSVVCFHTAPTFVDSVWQTLGPILAGATCLVLAPETSRNPAALLQALITHRATHFVAVPTLLRILLPLMQRLNAKGGPIPQYTPLCKHLLASSPPPGILGISCQCLGWEGGILCLCCTMPACC